MTLPLKKKEYIKLKLKQDKDQRRWKLCNASSLLFCYCLDTYRQYVSPTKYGGWFLDVFLYIGSVVFMSHIMHPLNGEKGKENMGGIGEVATDALELHYVSLKFAIATYFAFAIFRVMIF